MTYLGVPIDGEDYDFAQRVDFDLVWAFLESISKILCWGGLRTIFIHDSITCRLLIRHDGVCWEAKADAGTRVEWMNDIAWVRHVGFDTDPNKVSIEAAI